LVPRYERFLIRRCVHGDYLIFYRLQPKQIEVIHVLQGARDHCPEARQAPASGEC
jgi:toxin ParE1/3/4